MERHFLVKITFIFVTLSSFHDCFSQGKAMCEFQVVVQSIWIPETEIYSKAAPDVSLTLIFQEYFNDSIRIFINDEILVERWYITERNLSVVPYFEKVDKPLFGSKKLIRIELITKNECIEFSITEEYNFAYISRLESGKWFVAFSNYRRKYY